VKTYTVYRICHATRRKFPIVTLGERRLQERGNNDEDMMRLAKRLFPDTKDDLPYLIVASEK
jgi:hypothetical protein